MKSLIQRLAIDRVASSQRFLQPPSTATLGRLFRRIEWAAPSTTDLPLTSAGESTDAGTSASTPSGASNSTVSAASDGVSALPVARAADAASAFVADRAESGTCRMTPSPRAVNESRFASRASERPLLMRKVDGASVSVATAVTASGATSDGTSVATPDATSDATTLDTRALPTGPRSPLAQPVIGQTTAQGIKRQGALALVQRRIAEPLVSALGAPAANAFAPVPMARAGGASPAPPVLRKIERATPTSVAETSTITSRAPTAIARALATARSQSDEEMYSHAMQCAGDPEVDRIAEQVESRLARRLEIERERQGVRPWRQGS
jgi:hypothetical protein